MEELIKQYGDVLLGAIGALCVIGLAVYVLITGREDGSAFGMIHALLGRYL